MASLLPRTLTGAGCSTTGCGRSRQLKARRVLCNAAPDGGSNASSTAKQQSKSKAGGLGDVLGPIGLTLGSSAPEREDLGEKTAQQDKRGGLGDVLGPIGMTIGPSAPERVDEDEAQQRSDGEASTQGGEPPRSIASMSTAEWRAAYERDGCVDLWVEEEFNSGSRLVGGRTVHNGGVYGWRSGEGPSAGEAATHTVKIFNHYADQMIEVEVPEDRYIMFEAEDQGLELPYACRMGCCTACAVRVKEGEVYQPEALGISEELKAAGFALMCVGFPRADCVLETVDEDEVYDLQFGQYFEALATDPTAASIERDDFALEVANMDE